MKFEQLGIVAFFGILIPGIYLTVFILLAFACVLEVVGIPGHSEIFAFLNQNSVLSSGAFFFVSYLVGVIVRLFAPRFVDSASTFYLSVICRNKADWVYDIFPYQKTLKTALNALGMSQVIQLIESLNQQYGIENNTRFFNYCQLLIEANNEKIAQHVRQNEALVRFLAGTAFALMASSMIGLSFSIIFLINRQFSLFQVYIMLTFVSLVALGVILSRFKFQRRREVQSLWISTYLLIKGGIPNALGISPDELYKRISLEQNIILNTGTQQAHKRIQQAKAEAQTSQDTHSDVAEYTIHVAEKWSATDFATLFTAIRNIYTILMAQNDNIEEAERKYPEKALRIKQIEYASPGVISFAGFAESVRVLKELIEFFFMLRYKRIEADIKNKTEIVILTEKIVTLLKALGWEQEQINKYVELIIQNLLGIKGLTDVKKIPLPENVKTLPQTTQQEISALLAQVETT